MKKLGPIVLIFIALVLVGRGILRSAGNPAAPSAAVAQNDAPLVWPAVLAPTEKIDALERRTAKNYYIVFDGSGSMSETNCAAGSQKLVVAKKAVQEFAEQIPKDANLGLAVFDGSGLSERLPLGPNNRQEFSRQVEAVEAKGGTPLKSALRLAGEKLSHQAAMQMGYGEYHMVVVTDGAADPNEDPRAIVDSLLAQSPVVLHTVGFCIGQDHSLNQAGKVLYQSADNPEQLRQGLKEVLGEAVTFNVDDFKK